MKPKKVRLWLVPVLCYAGAAVLYLALALAGFLLAQAENLPPRSLEFENLYPEGMLLRENEYGGSDLIAADSDPRLIYSPGEPFAAGRVVFTAETVNRPGGEMALYYTTAPGEDFSEQKRISARQGEGGSWVFDLGGRELHALRLDPGTTAGVLWRNWALWLNAEKPVAEYFLPSLRTCFLLLFLPAFLAAALLEARQLLQDFALRKKAKPRTS